MESQRVGHNWTTNIIHDPHHSLQRRQSSVGPPRKGVSSSFFQTLTQSFHPQIQVLATQFLRASIRHFPSMTPVIPVSTLGQACGTQGQCSRAEIRGHLEHYGTGAAPSQMNALCKRETLQESRREAERRREGQTKWEKDRKGDQRK